MFKALACLSVAALSLNARANEGGISKLSPLYEAGTTAEPRGLWPFAGIETGVMSSSPQARTGGLPTQVKVLGSYYFDQQPLVSDLGVGLHNETLTQSGTGSNSVQTFFAELAARYVFTDRWQVGAVWNTLVDNGYQYRSNNDNLASFIGAQALKEFTWNQDYLARLGVRAMTSVGFNGGTVNTVMAELEVSFGPGADGHRAVASEGASRPSPAHLSGAADSNKLVRALADNRGLFRKVVVIGYFADPAHRAFAKSRAHLVAQKLVAAGVEPKQIVEEQRGRETWLSQRGSPSALLSDERVRVEFEGVGNDAALSGVIDSAAL